MCKADIGFLIEFLSSKVDDSRSLSEWRQELNGLLTKNRRLSLRELAFAFRFIKGKNLLVVEKNLTYYSFAPSQVQEISSLQTLTHTS